jgi:hypothetical protein
MNRRLLSLAVLVGAVLVGCGGTELPSQETPAQVEETGTVSEALVTCSTSCRLASSISCTGSTCSAANGSVTCDGVTTYCPPPEPFPTECTATMPDCTGQHGSYCAPNKSSIYCCIQNQWVGQCICSQNSWTCPL